MALKFSGLTPNDTLTGAELTCLSQSIAGTLTSVKATLDELQEYITEFTAEGDDAVTRSLLEKARDEVSPEDYGAVGDGDTDDTLAWQAAVDSGAKRIRGRQGAIYLINGQRTQWSEEDLHRIGLVPYGTASFSDGYYCGVRVPTAVAIEDANFYVTKGADNNKAFHAFAFGDPTSVSRSSRNAIMNCTFKVYEDFGGGSKRPRAFLCQSVDDFVFTDNRLIGFDEDNSIIGGYMFDCRDADLSNNKGKYVELGFVTEFCTGVSANDNKFYDCDNLIDVDKACGNFTICDNTYNRSAQAGAGTVDGVIEINGIDGLICTGNVINRSRAGIQYSAKGGVADSWAAALAGTAVATYYPPKNIISQNIISNTDYYAIRAGSQWTSYAHSGVAGASNITIRDTITNAYIQGGEAAGEAAAVLVNECDGFVFDGSIDGSGAHGIFMRTSLETDVAGAGTWSITKARVGGMIRNCDYRGFRSEAVNEIIFDGLYLTDCGDEGSVMMETRSMHIKPAKIRGRLNIERGDSTATIGWAISAGIAGTWDETTFSVLMDSVIVKGAFDATDGIRLSPQGTSIVSGDPVIFRSAIIDEPDLPYFTEDGSRVYLADPTSNIVPRYIGERVFDSAADNWYIATGNTSADWQAF